MDVKILSTILLYYFVVVLIYSYTKMKYVNTTVFAYPLIRFTNFDIIFILKKQVEKTYKQEDVENDFN